MNQSSAAVEELQYHISKNLGAQRVYPERPDEQMTMPLHIFEPRWFHRTQNGLNQLSSCGVTPSTRIWVPDRNSLKDPMGQ